MEEVDYEKFRQQVLDTFLGYIEKYRADYIFSLLNPEE